MAIPDKWQGTPLLLHRQLALEKGCGEKGRRPAVPPPPAPHASVTISPSQGQLRTQKWSICQL